MSILEDRIRILRVYFDFLGDIESAVSNRKDGEPLGSRARLEAHLYWYNVPATDKIKELRACLLNAPIAESVKLNSEMEKVFEEAIAKAHSGLLTFLGTVVPDVRVYAEIQSFPRPDRLALASAMS